MIYHGHQYRAANSALTFNEEVTAYYSGQTNLALTAYQDGVVVGAIDYVEYQGVPSISMVTVLPEHRRQGIATQMLRQLQKQYPDVEIGGQDNLTDLGARWNQGITWQERPNQRYQELTEEKTRLETEAARLMALYDQGEVPKAQLRQLGDDMNVVHDRLYQIEEEIHGMKPTRRIFIEATKKVQPGDSKPVLPLRFVLQQEKLFAYLGDQQVGSISWLIESEDDGGGPSVILVDVVDQFKRRGIATQLLRELQKLYPGEEIGGMDQLTDEGELWSQSLKWENDPMDPSKRIFTGAVRTATPTQQVNEILEIAERDAVQCAEVLDNPNGCRKRASTQMASRLNGLAGQQGAACQFDGVRGVFSSSPTQVAVGAEVHSSRPHWSWSSGEAPNAVVVSVDAMGGNLVVDSLHQLWPYQPHHGVAGPSGRMDPGRHDPREIHRDPGGKPPAGNAPPGNPRG